MLYPLLNTRIDEFIKYNGCKYCARADRSNSVDIDYNHELLKLMLMKEVMKVPEHGKLKYEVKFPQSRGQPLILHQSYIKSEQLMELFKNIGDKYGVPYNIRPNSQVTLNAIFLFIL